MKLLFKIVLITLSLIPFAVGFIAGIFWVAMEMGFQEYTRILERFHNEK